MNYRSVLIIICVICFIFFGNINFNNNLSINNKTNKEPDLQSNKLTDFFVAGEELNYEVSYSVFKLGSIKVKILDKLVKNGRTKYKAIAYIDSYNVPFVTIHNIFESEIDEDLYSDVFIGSELVDKNWRYTKYNFDYPQNKVFVERGYQYNNSIEFKKTVDLQGKHFQDGLSLFFYARGILRSQNNVNIPVFINEKSESTSIKYPCTNETTEIDAVKYPIDVLFFEGKAGFVGIVGLTGTFRGWFSNDDAKVPIVARMNVFIGSVYIELKSWNRPGWVPPKGKE